jgi:hypothetical protein
MTTRSISMTAPRANSLRRPTRVLLSSLILIGVWTAPTSEPMMDHMRFSTTPCLRVCRTPREPPTPETPNGPPRVVSSAGLAKESGSQGRTVPTSTMLTRAMVLLTMALSFWLQEMMTEWSRCSGIHLWWRMLSSST